MASSSSHAHDCDVVVAGGGPAGSAASAWLARAGRRVVLFERDEFPRFHIGESLLASVNDALAAIGAADVVRQAGFPQKWGATFMTGDGENERYADFSIAPDVPVPQTWQVHRAEFDHLLLKHAMASGVDVRQRHRVLDAAFDAAGVTVTWQGSEGGPQTLRAQALVDATGRGLLLSRKFNLRVDEGRLANIAVFSHYAGVPRPEGRRSGDIRIIARDDLGWFWMIPISANLMSVGVVLPQAAARRVSGVEPQALLERAIAETPVVATLLANARREWPVRVEKDFSFASRAYAGDRWILVGDAGSFLDPVFSTGVAVALESGVEGATAVHAALTAGDLSTRQFATFARRQRQRYLSFRRFVLGFYTSSFRDLFFNEDPPQHMFRALITVFAGYWKPSIRTRIWVAMFFGLVRLQRYVRLVPPVFSTRSTAKGKGTDAAGKRELTLQGKGTDGAGKGN